MEQYIKLAARLYRCRDTARQIYGDAYQETLLPFIRRIRNWMAASGADEVNATLALCESLRGMENEATGVLLFSAALVEMLEPSEKEGSK